jgi:hypothetical protein
MKKSQLRKLIRESIKQLLTEQPYPDQALVEYCPCMDYDPNTHQCNVGPTIESLEIFYGTTGLRYPLLPGEQFCKPDPASGGFPPVFDGYTCIPGPPFSEAIILNVIGPPTGPINTYIFTTFPSCASRVPDTFNCVGGSCITIYDGSGTYPDYASCNSACRGSASTAAKFIAKICECDLSHLGMPCPPIGTSFTTPSDYTIDFNTPQVGDTFESNCYLSTSTYYPCTWIVDRILRYGAPHPAKNRNSKPCKGVEPPENEGCLDPNANNFNSCCTTTPGCIPTIHNIDCCKYDCPPQPCGPNQIWDYSLCKCICDVQLECEPPLVFNPDTCECDDDPNIEPPWVDDPVLDPADPCPPQPCGPNQIWDSNQCKCICDIQLECTPPLVFNLDTCKCDKKPDLDDLKERLQKLANIKK